MYWKKIIRNVFRRLPLSFAENVDGSQPGSASLGRKNFVILTQRRSGSNFLILLLNQHPQIICHSELFDRKLCWTEPKTSFFEPGNLIIRLLKNLFPITFLRFILNEKNRISGFKIFSDHNSKVLNYLSRNNNIKVIILKRQNFLKREISEQVALKTGAYIQFSENKNVEDITFDVDKLRDNYNNYTVFFKDFINGLKDDKRDFCVVHYEDLISENYGVAMRQISDFLGLDSWAFNINKVPSKRQGTRPMSNVLKNYDQVKEELKGSIFESMCD